MNAIDLLLAFLVLLGAWGGWRRGFVRALLELLVLAVSLVAAFLAYRWPAAWIAQQWPALEVWSAATGFIAVFALVQLLVGSIAGRLAASVSPRAHVHAGNRLLGLLPGAANGLINAAVATVVLLALPLPDTLARMMRDSEAAVRLSPGVEWVQAQLAPIFQPAIERSLQALTVPQDSTRRVELRFKVADPTVRPELEARMLELVNEERAKEGLKPLKADPELAEVARAHSRDMFARGYFSHVSPDGGKLSDRMRKGELRYLLAGENLALAPTLPMAHQGLMNSPGHRANILRPQFGRVGIGVLDGGRHGLMVTQDFRN
ncbi:MAG: CvpA family protein [Pseudomonadota bacterium]